VDELNLAAAGLEADAAAALPWTSTTRPRWSTSLRWATWWAFLRWLRFQWSRDASPRHGAFNDRAVSTNPSFYPYGIYTIPEISFIGKTEEQLTDEDVPYEVGMAYYREVARGQIRGDTTGRLKLVFHRDTRKVLGVHIIGEGASRAGSHRPGGDDPGRHNGLLHRHRIQLPHARGVLQGGGVQRAGPPAPLPGGLALHKGPREVHAGQER
jgi:hypothetical protein